MQSTSEYWLPVPGYEGFYEVSNHDRVRSVDRVVPGSRGRMYNRKGKILRTTVNRGGSHQVSLNRDGKGKTWSVRVLFREASGQSHHRECDGCGREFEHPFHNTTRAVYCSEECKPRCSVEGCERPRRRREWCGRHYATWRRTGDANTPLVNPWSTEWVCVVCGADVPKGSGRRKHCSSNCQVIDSRLKGNVPRYSDCAACGVKIDLFERNYNGRKKRMDTRLCDTCGRVNSREWSRHLEGLLNRDNHTCGICSKHIDTSIKYPNPMSATVDHILPRSLGGTNDVDNLQPSHALCNSTKQDRIGFRIA